MAGQTSLIVLNADRPRILKTGWFEATQFERLTGKSLFAGLEKALQDISDIRAMAYVSMLQDAKSHGERLTIDKPDLAPGEISVDAVLDAANEAVGMGKVFEVVMDAFDEFYNSHSKEVKKKAKAEKNSKAAAPEQ